MSVARSALCLLAAFSAFAAAEARAERKTVCTITVNSPDEKETLAQRLPKGDYQFVELVEKGREDWLGSSCRSGVQCDVLVVSGHFNAGDVFYSDKLENDEHLQVDELERASCSNSCPGLFSRLKEVYLFGCESLNPDATKYSSSYGESGRERMRRIFHNVPSIYGFSSSAPVGPTAAMLLNRYFDSGGAGAFATGRTNSRLLKTFARNSMTSVSGVRDADPRSSYRSQVCRFFDERQPAAEKVRFIHGLMRRDMVEARQFFKRIEKLFASLSESDRESPAFQRALAEISADEAARERYLVFTRNAEPAIRARMIALAGTLGWLSTESQRSERVALVNEILARPAMGYAEVDLVCSLNGERELDSQLARITVAPARAERATHAAAMACLGSPEAKSVVLRALASPNEKDVEAAQVYLRHRPLTDPRDLRALAGEIVRMPHSPAQVRALDTLGRLNIADRQILTDLAHSFATAGSVSVQRAIAEVFIRSDPAAMPRREIVSVLREHRLPAPDGRSDLIDVLLQRLGAPS
jgi:hypothetical protein